MDFSTREIAPKKVRGNDVDFSISEITSKKYVGMTRKSEIGRNLVFEVST